MLIQIMPEKRIQKAWLVITTHKIVAKHFEQLRQVLAFYNRWDRENKKEIGYAKKTKAIY
ncbi:MAG: hypothetical protein CMK65_02215 [Pseudoalteromonas sp.]|nr:hypothetical protein [Pseudoalteromonas sp.]|tara:strand:+ start:293 stop:472 length:180 start_codon:yes stop_codon:yes gene_type:complete